MIGKITFLALIALASSAATESPEDGIITKEYEINSDGSFASDVKTANGIAMAARGYINSEDVYVIEGQYSYISPEGENIQVSYVADENGYQPTGSHIPQIPEYVQRSIAYIRSHTPTGSVL